jgi:hypothetical protein
LISELKRYLDTSLFGCEEGVPCPHAAFINKPPLPDHSFVNFAFNRHISTHENKTKMKEGRSYACEPERQQEQGKESDLIAIIYLHLKILKITIFIESK